MALFGKAPMRGVHTFTVTNVSEALYVVKQALEADGVEVETRNGKAIEFREPCAIVYNSPRERVLFYPERDANPIFHFMESLSQVTKGPLILNVGGQIFSINQRIIEAYQDSTLEAIFSGR